MTLASSYYKERGKNCFVAYIITKPYTNKLWNVVKIFTITVKFCVFLRISAARVVCHNLLIRVWLKAKRSWRYERVVSYFELQNETAHGKDPLEIDTILTEMDSAMITVVEALFLTLLWEMDNPTW